MQFVAFITYEMHVMALGFDTELERDKLIVKLCTIIAAV